MYIDIFQYIEDMKARLGKESKTYAAVAEACMDHADLRAHQGGGTIRLCCGSVNQFVDQFDLDRGQDLYVYPFIKDKASVIHSDPPFFFIGSRNSSGFGIYPAMGWEEEMEAEGINEAVVKKVHDFLRANVPYDLPDEPLKT